MTITAVALNPTVGDVAGNAAAMERHVRGASAGIVVFPELAICGYPPKDLLLMSGFVAACEAATRRVGAAAAAGVTVIVGTPLVSRRHRARLANSLMVFTGGRHVLTYEKRLLPTYDVFDEDRYFEPGDVADAAIVEHRDASGVVRIGLGICEDLWKGEDAGFASRYADAVDPVAGLAGKIDVLVSPSASPFVVGKRARHVAILRGHAARLGVPVVSVNQAGANDELVFDGHVIVVDRGGVRDEYGFEERVVEVGVRGEVLAAARRADPLGGGGGVRLEEKDLFRALVCGTRDYLRKTGFTRAILGLSGGIDSAVTAAIAAAAIGAGSVTGILLPSKYSSDHSISDAEMLARNLGMLSVTVPIEGGVESLRQTIDPAFAGSGLSGLGAKLPDLAEENLQSRVRGTILMAWSNRTGAIVLTTGNKSELAVGYCTLYGDMNGGLAVLSDVGKLWVYRLARWMNEHFAEAGFEGPPIPIGSIEKPPSAELRPDQKDQDSLPEYAVLDAIIEALVERRESVAEAAGRLGFDLALVAKVSRMIDLAEYKRKQAAIGLKVTSVAFGSGRRMPIAMRR